jgi:hypothetical protein
MLVNYMGRNKKYLVGRGLHWRITRQINTLQKQILDRREQLIKCLNFESYYRYGTYNGKVISWDYGSEVAEDKIIKKLYQEIEYLLNIVLPPKVDKS